jgi:Icc-related predicted phosphoesterase
MIICLISDTHGYLPKTLPTHDLLLHAGDICPVYNHDEWFQLNWLETTFKEWVEKISPHFYATFGNHDWIGKQYDMIMFDNGIIYRETTIEYNGLKIYLAPYQLPFCDWAFNEPEEKLVEIYSKIPDDVDIIVNHGPPKGYLDWVPYRGGENTGSQALLDAIDRVKPKLVSTGHIHDQYGISRRNETLIVNCSLLNDNYKMVHTPILIDTETWNVI